MVSYMSFPLFLSVFVSSIFYLLSSSFIIIIVVFHSNHFSLINTPRVFQRLYLSFRRCGVETRKSWKLLLKAKIFNFTGCLNRSLPLHLTPKTSFSLFFISSLFLPLNCSYYPSRWIFILAYVQLN